MRSFVASVALMALVASSALADVKHVLEGEQVAILSQDLDVSHDGHFTNNYESANGISVKEQGAPKAVGTETPVVIQGTASWTAPDGTPVQIGWTADENGANFQGSHVPVAPELPIAIQRSLEYIAAHPYVEPTEKKAKF